MTWPEFLSQISNEVSLVGPLLDRARAVMMPTVFVDGGADFREASAALSSRKWPMVSVGDGDSTAGALDQRIPARKDFSDLAFVLRALPTSVSALEMLGFLGGRRDHELANFGEVHNFLALRGMATAHFHFGATIAVIAFNGALEIGIDGVFSVMAFAPTDVEISGDCEYNYSGRIGTASSLGLSNIGRGRVIFSSGSPLFIFLEYIPI